MDLLVVTVKFYLWIEIMHGQILHTWLRRDDRSNAQLLLRVLVFLINYSLGTSIPSTRTVDNIMPSCLAGQLFVLEQSSPWNLGEKKTRSTCQTCILTFRSISFYSGRILYCKPRTNPSCAIKTNSSSK